jgi:hypothetical protein
MLSLPDFASASALGFFTGFNGLTFVLLALILSIYGYIKYLGSIKSKNGLPAVWAVPLLSIPKSVLHAPFLWNFQNHLKSRVYTSFGLWPSRKLKNVSVSHPKLLREILQSDYVTYDRGDRRFRRWFGETSATRTERGLTC